MLSRVVFATPRYQDSAKQVLQKTTGVDIFRREIFPSRLCVLAECDLTVEVYNRLLGYWSIDKINDVHV